MDLIGREGKGMEEGGGVVRKLIKEGWMVPGQLEIEQFGGGKKERGRMEISVFFFPDSFSIFCCVGIRIATLHGFVFGCSLFAMKRPLS